jgi:hypothetical protein
MGSAGWLSPVARGMRPKRSPISRWLTLDMTRSWPSCGHPRPTLRSASRLQPPIRVGHAGGDLVTYREHGRYSRFLAGTTDRHATGISKDLALRPCPGSAAFWPVINRPLFSGSSGNQVASRLAGPVIGSCTVAGYPMERNLCRYAINNLHRDGRGADGATLEAGPYSLAVQLGDQLAQLVRTEIVLARAENLETQLIELVGTPPVRFDTPGWMSRDLGEPS